MATSSFNINDFTSRMITGGALLSLFQCTISASGKGTKGKLSDFQFMWSEKDKESIHIHSFTLSPEDEGRILFFPAWLNHQVYPFYECDEERITISGNIILKIPNNSRKLQEVSSEVYEDKEKILKMLENTVEVTKKELEQMKKEREKEE